MSRERLERLFDQHHQRLYRLARRLCLDPEESRDLVQETYLRAARRPGSVPVGSGPEEAWLVRVLINLFRDRNRRLRVRARRAPRIAAGSASVDSPERQVVARDAVRKALSSLPPRRRAAIVLHHLEELPVARVAQVLGVSQVTVRYHLSLGRRQLAAALTGEEP